MSQDNENAYDNDPDYVDLEAVAAKWTAEERGEPAPAPVQPQITEPTPEEKPSAKQLATLAKLDAEIREREMRLAAREKEQADRLAALEEELRGDPLGVLERYGHDPILTANTAYSRELGDEAPEEFKKKAAEDALMRRLDRLEKQQSNREKEWAEQREKATWDAQCAQLDREIQSLITDVPEQHAALKTIASANPSRAYDDAAQVAAAVYSKLGRLPSAKEVIDALESAYDEDRRLWSGAPPSKPTPAATESSATRQRNASALSDADAANKPDRSPPSKLTDEDYIRAGMKAWEERKRANGR